MKRTQVHKRITHKWRSEKGVALILTLGLLALLLVLVMVFAFDATTTNSVSYNREAETRARMLSRSGVERALGLLRHEIGGNQTDNVYLDPGSQFYQPTDSGWSHRRYLPTVDASFDTDVDASLAVKFGDYSLVAGDVTAAIPGTGWTTIKVKEDISAGGGSTMQEKTVGRLAYLMIDESGKIDPALAVDKDADEADTTVRYGTSPTEIQLSTVLGETALARQFHPQNSSTGHAGQLISGAGWMSHRHMIAATAGSQVQTDSIAATLIPTSVADPEQFWVDVNADGIASDTELVDRMDLREIGSGKTPADIYDHVLGVAAGNSTRDDSSYYSPWLQAQNPSTAAEARRMAAQFAVCAYDWADDSTAVTHGYIADSSAGTDYALSYSTDGTYSRPANTESVVHGVEDYVGVAHVAVGANYLYPLPFLLHLQPLIWVQVASPTGKTMPYDFEVAVTLTFEIETDIGLEYQVTRTITVDKSDFGSSQSNGDALFMNMPTWKISPSISLGDLSLSGIGSLFVKKMQIDTIEVTHRTSASQSMKLPVVRYHGATGDQDVVAAWSEPPLTLHSILSAFQNYVSLEAKDPLFNVRSELDADFSDYWTKTPATHPSVIDLLLTLLLGSDGLPENTHGYRVNNGYCDVTVGDQAFSALSQLGRIHDGVPNRSMRLWALPSQSAGHDLHLLDMFKVGSQTASPGRVSLNTRHSSVMRALVENTELNASQLTSAILGSNGTNGGSPYLYRGDVIDIFDTVSLTASFSDTSDDTVEDAIASILPLTTTRQNYYTIVVASESLQDLGTLRHDPGGATVMLDGATGQYARIKAHNAAIAFVYRDAYTNKTRILRYEQINE